MFRLLGFLIGSVTSIVIILMVTGIPNFHLEDPAIDQKRFDDAVEKLMARKRDAEQVTTKFSDDVVQAAESVQETLAASSDDTLNQAQQPDHVTEENPANSLQDITQPNSNFEESTAMHPMPNPADMQWYSFWTPFHSRIAASGFVSRLEEVTGLDYRVVKIETGIYEVAFNYGDDDERRSKLSLISAATGLDLPDS
jgi:hypothetical protein